MPSRKEIEDQIAQLQADLENAGDEDTELWIKNDKGAETKVPASRAGTWLKENFGISLRDEAPKSDPQEPPKEDPKPAGGGYFGKRKG